MDFAVLADHRLKNRSERKREIEVNEKGSKYLDLARELKKAMEHKGDGDSIYNWSVWNGSQRFGKGDGRVGSQSMNRAIQTTALLRSARILSLT